MFKYLSLSIALLLLSACSENKDPAVIERKGAVQDNHYQAKHLHKAPLASHGSISESSISEKSIPVIEQDVYQNEEPSKPESQELNEESFDLSDIETHSKAEPISGEYKLNHPLADKQFIWPANGSVISRFGDHGGVSHEGITIGMPEGTAVKSASDGTVLFVGNDATYGNLVIIQHKNNISTAYAHNSDLLVKKGAKVSRGAVIAHSGKSGDALVPQLYFSVRKGSMTVDPEKTLL